MLKIIMLKIIVENNRNVKNNKIYIIYLIYKNENN